MAERRLCVEELNRNAQAAIAAVLADGLVLRSSDLIDRVMALGYRYRPYVAGIVAKAFLAGMIQRTGTSKPYSYQLTPDWPVDPHLVHALRANVQATTPPAPPKQRASASASTLAYAGPAYSGGLLSPSLGVVCGVSQEEREGELPPHIGGRIVDSLHRRFDEVFRGVE